VGRHSPSAAHTAVNHDHRAINPGDEPVSGSGEFLGQLIAFILGGIFVVVLIAIYYGAGPKE
jgi:hypothetical protein